MQTSDSTPKGAGFSIVRFPPAARGGHNRGPVLAVGLEDLHTGVRVRLTKRTTMIGSDPGADVRLEAPGIQPFHCAVGMREEGILVVWDLGIDSRALVNGRRYMNAVITGGDLVTVGDMSFRVHVLNATAPRSSLAG